MAATLDEEQSETHINGRMSGVVYEKIVELIASNVFPVKSRLPSEMDLSERFEASRPVVREALQRLRDDGLIVSRQGSGSYVQRRPDVEVLQLVPVGSLADVQRCFEFRAGLEPATAALAALRRDNEDLARIDEAMAVLDKCVAEGRLGAEEDFELHNAIAIATKNHYHSSIEASLRSHVIAGMNVTRSLSMRWSEPHLRAVQQEHEMIVKAIKAQKEDDAFDAMKNHIVNARKRMFEGI